MGARRERDFYIMINYRQYGIEGCKEFYISVMFEGFKGGDPIFVVFPYAAPDWEKFASAVAERCEKQNYANISDNRIQIVFTMHRLIWSSKRRVIASDSMVAIANISIFFKPIFAHRSNICYSRDCVSRHQGGPIEGPPETPCTSVL